MFKQFQAISEDPIVKLIGLCKADLRPHKIDAGVGVFRDENGNTPVMQAVRDAEQILHDQQTSKSYVGLAGDEQFNAHIRDLIFANHAQKNRIRAIQTPGGCGALRVLSEMLYRIASDKVMWVSDPTWGNHYPIFRGTGFAVNTYPYLNRKTSTVNIDALMNKLSTLGKQDIVIFHGCCHNPSGAELQPHDWDDIAEICAKNGIFPLVDLAYLGLADSLEQDAYGVRKLAEKVESMVVASSCSKNFGLYRDRVGCALLLGETETSADIARGHVLSAARTSYSMPPDHGAALVSVIMSNEPLRASWENELTSMRERILGLRQTLKSQLAEKTGSNVWDFIADHRGMFSLFSLNNDQVNTLRDEYAVYIVAGGRVNIAGIKDAEQMAQFADALVAVTTPT